MTSSNRVDAASPFLDELRTQASKGFDGSVSASANGLEVVVYLAEGEVYAIHSPQFTFPSRELAVAYTGVEPTGEDPLRWLYEHIDPDRHGQGLSADDVDRIVRNWSYGLLASALTWRNPKVRRQRKSTTTGNKFLRTPLQVVIADVTARVDDLVSSWAVLTDYLASLDDFPKGARPASVACGKLFVVAPGHDLLKVQRPIDEVARVLGTTRYELVSAAARVLLSGGQLHVGLAETSPDMPAYPVPEWLEDPANEWASVEAAAEAERPALDLVPEPTPEPEPEPEPAEPEAETSLYDSFDLDEEPEQDETLVEPVLEVALEPVDDNPLEGAVELAHSTDIEPAGDPLTHSGAAQWARWRASSRDERERAVRDDIYEQAVLAAVQKANERLAVLAEKVTELESAASTAVAHREEAAAAEHAAAQAQVQYDAAGAEVHRIEVDGEVYRNAQESANRELAAALDSVAVSQEDVAAAERALAAARERLAANQAGAAEAEHVLQQAEHALQVHYHEPLAQAQDALATLERDVVAPARERLEAAIDHVRAALASAADLANDVYAVGYEAELGIRVVRDIDDSGQIDSDPLVAQLRTEHERLSAVLDQLPELLQDEQDGTDEQTVAEEPVAQMSAGDGFDDVLGDLDAQHETTDGDAFAELLDETVATPEDDLQEETPEPSHQSAPVDESLLLGLDDEPAVERQGNDDLDSLLDDAEPSSSDEAVIDAGSSPLPDFGFDDVDDVFSVATGADEREETDDLTSLLSDAADDSAADHDVDDLDELSMLAGETGGSLPSVPTFDEVLSDTMPPSTWNGQTADWGRVEEQS